MLIKQCHFLLLFVLFASGCAMTSLQKEQVAKFGKATEAMGSFAEKELLGMRNEIVEMNTAALILAVDNNNPRINLNMPTSAESAAKRLAVAKALRSYGSLLNELVTADRTESISKEAQELVANFNSALDQGLSDKQEEAAIGLVTSMGKMWVEKKKKDAVKDIVRDYAPLIQELADLLSADFTTTGDGYLGGYTAVAGQLENRAIGLLTGGRHAALTDRELAVSAFVVAQSAEGRADKLQSVAQRAIGNLKLANQELVEVMEHDAPGAKEITAYAKSIQDLVNMAEILAGN